jgi:uncharacterized lipoprotein YddW (UPF0748 family)
VAVLVGAAGSATASGLRNDYVKAPDGALTAVTAYDKTRSGDGVYVYTPAWGSSTQQNQWGAEAVVQDGKVTRLTAPGSGGNAPIPAEGYTLSGFGSGASWMSTHLVVGQPVSILKEQILQTSATATTTATTINPQPPYEFPGGRGANQLIAYTDAYGQDTTGTNQYGTEAVATADGAGYRVVSVGGNNSTIPDGGLVLSGHGTQQTWIQQNLIVGTLLSLDMATRRVSATTDATSYLFQAERGIARAEDALTVARAAYADAPLDDAARTLTHARDQLAAARSQHQAGDDINAITTADTATATAETARELTIESRAMETRGVWHRPAEANPTEVEATVAAMAKTGINQLYLESFWGGRTIYPTPLAEQNSHFAGWDPLAAYVAATKRHGIELHLWMHTFYVGTDSGDGSGNGSPLAQQHPDWLVVDKAGRTRSTTEPGYYFVDPAVPAARAWLLNLFIQAVNSYDVAGLQLDYIRYPKQGGPDTVTSYNATARAAYQKEHGVDPATLQPGSSDYQQWLDWQTQQVTDFVRAARKALPTTTVLSSALETTDNEADVRDFHQDFASWVNEGLLDTVAPEVYTAGVSDVLQRSKEFGALIGDHAFTSIGIAPAYVGATPDVAVDEVAATRQAGATGAVNFVWKSMTPAFQQALARSVYRKPAVDPQTEPVAATVVQADDMLRRVHTVYNPALSASAEARLTTQITQLRRDLAAQRLRQAGAGADRLRRTIETVSAPAPVKARLTQDLQLLDHVLDVAAPTGWPAG